MIFNVHNTKHWSLLFAAISAILWCVSGSIRVPWGPRTDMDKIGTKLSRFGWISAAAAVAAGLSVLFSVIG